MRSITAALLLTCAAFSAPATSQTFSPERIRADVAFLADDLLEGRNTGTRGYDLAARWVATRFEASRDLVVIPAARSHEARHVHPLHLPRDL